MPSAAIKFLIHHCPDFLLALALGNPDMRKWTAHTVTRMPPAISQVLARFVAQKLCLLSDFESCALKARRLASSPTAAAWNRDRHTTGRTRSEVARCRAGMVAG